MDAVQLQLSDEIDQATQRLLDAARVVAEPDLRSPSLLPGWSRAHVIAHLAGGADAMRDLLRGVRSGRDQSGRDQSGQDRAGRDRAAYASAAARDAAIESGAARTTAELMTWLADSAMAFRTVTRRLPDDRWQVPVQMLDSAPFPAGELLVKRLVEVELHHCDLGIGYGPAQWPAAFGAMELAEPMGSQRAERLSYEQPAISARARSAARPAPPYRPGQPLPGSWIGRSRA
jgi:maleylpyruvate isomerase